MIKNIAIIPARLGSKRIPYKNILPFCGKHLIGWTIETAIEAELFDKIVVATESTIVAEISKKFGAEIFYIDAELTKDNVFANEVVVDVLRSLKSNGKNYNNVFLLQPTSPLRSSADLEKAYEGFIGSGAHFLVSAVEIDPHYFHWALQKKNEPTELKDGETIKDYEMVFPDFLKDRSLLPKKYRPDGSIKIAKVEKFLETKHFFSDNLQIYEVPEERAVHIGTQFEWDLAEFLVKKE